MNLNEIKKPVGSLWSYVNRNESTSAIFSTCNVGRMIKEADNLYRILGDEALFSIGTTIRHNEGSRFKILCVPVSGSLDISSMFQSDVDLVDAASYRNGQGIEKALHNSVEDYFLKFHEQNIDRNSRYDSEGFYDKYLMPYVESISSKIPEKVIRSKIELVNYSKNFGNVFLKNVNKVVSIINDPVMNSHEKSKGVTLYLQYVGAIANKDNGRSFYRKKIGAWKKKNDI